MATFDHERAHMAANLVSDPPVIYIYYLGTQARLILCSLTLEIRRNEIRRNDRLIHDVNPSQLSGASHREALLDARRDTVTHRATK